MTDYGFLSDEQRTVVDDVFGYVRVAACPGSGKTTTLVYRTRRIGEVAGVAPERILMTTFTRAAAADMRSRYVDAFLGGDGNLPTPRFDTLNAFCLDVLRRYGGFGYVRILDEVETRAFFRRFAPRRFGRTESEAFVRDVLTNLAVMRGNLIRIEDFVPVGVDPERFRYLASGYDEYKRNAGVLDHDDVLVETRNLLLSVGSVAEFVARAYPFMQVDEYQDVNPVQRDVVRAIAERCGNLCVVGDDDQAIYGFRGATPRIMLDFEVDFPNAKSHVLSTNYRSGTKIVDMASALIRNNSNRLEKAFVCGRSESGVARIERRENRSESILDVVEWCRARVRDRLPLGDVAILTRTRFGLAGFANVLERNKIPFVSFERTTDPYDSWMFDDVLSLRALALGGGTAEEFSRVLWRHNKYFGKTFASAFRFGDVEGTRLEALKVVESSGKEDWAKRNDADSIEDFFRVLRAFAGDSPADAMETLEIVSKYSETVRTWASGFGEDAAVWVDLYETIREDAETFGTWDEFLRNGTERRNAPPKRPSDGNAVVLSTMHGAKGLEWPIVFVVDVVDGLVPHKGAATPEAVEEERRLLYVAMTRAKDELYLFTHDSAEDGRATEESPFLAEIEGNGAEAASKSDSGPSVSFSSDGSVIRLKTFAGTYEFEAPPAI